MRKDNLENVIAYLVIIIILASVFLFGATTPEILAGIEASIIAVFILLYVSTKQLEKTPLFKPFVLFISLLFFQIIPLPSAVVKLISPHSVYIREKLGIASPWTTISLIPAMTVREITRWITILLLYLLVVNLFYHKKRLYRLLNAIFTLSIFEAIYGILLFATGSHALLWYRKPEYVANRVHGTYRNPDHFAGYMEMVIPLHLSQVSLWRHKEPYETEEKAKKFLGIFLITLLALSLFFSISRAGIMAFTVSLSFWTYMTVEKNREGKIKKYVWIFLFLLIAYLMWMGVEPILERFSKAAVELERGRTPAWKDTLRIVKDFPLFGTGAGTYRFVFTIYKSFPQQALWDHAHNDYLEFLAEYGVAGLLAFLWMIKRILSWGIKTKNRIAIGAATGIIAMLVHSFFDFNLHIPANAYIFFTLAGILWLTHKQPHY